MFELIILAAVIVAGYIGYIMYTKHLSVQAAAVLAQANAEKKAAADLAAAKADIANDVKKSTASSANTTS